MNLNICVVENGAVKAVLESCDVNNWDEYKEAHVEAEDYRAEYPGTIEVLTDEEISLFDTKHSVLRISKFAKDGKTWWIDRLGQNTSHCKALEIMKSAALYRAMMHQYKISELIPNSVVLSGNTGIANCFFEYVVYTDEEAQTIIDQWGKGTI